MDNWYIIKNIDQIDSPSLAIYADRVRQNIQILVSSMDDISRLRPHVKTHKSPEVSRMMLNAGIKKFKCATIAEAEMLAGAGAADILLAYQPVGPNVSRLAELVKRFPNITWACLIDNYQSAEAISSVFGRSNQTINIYIDLNVGMNRTGIRPGDAFPLAEQCHHLDSVTLVGLHAYDGHLRDADLAVRTQKCDEAFSAVKSLQEAIEKKYNRKIKIVAGGTPTFSIHSKRKEIECSPGTFIYWDQGYEQILKEQHYLHAALVISRIISLPAENVICTDLGHKAIASENPISNRVHFLNAPELEAIGHSEEHMVFRNPSSKKYSVGDVLYGVPYHICPTIALHDVANVVINGEVKEKWETTARRRRLSV